MQLRDDFIFVPLPELKEPIHKPFPGSADPLGPLADLPGTWGGTGFNVIWRPFNINEPDNTTGQDHFLELNLTDDSIQFNGISGAIPNRGLLQQDINMFGVTYLQQISDANLHAGLHIEPGIWAAVPATTDPSEGPTVVRMASIPHGTTLLAQGTAKTNPGAPTIPDIDIVPFVTIDPSTKSDFPEHDLAKPTNFRSPPKQLAGITQAMVDNPNSILQAAIAGQHILSTTTLHLDTTLSLAGSGTSNTVFLQGALDGPNAMSANVSADFYIELVSGTPPFLQLQYSQTVLLQFNNFTWPHVTVGTLKKNIPIVIPPWKTDPSAELIRDAERHPMQLLENTTHRNEKKAPSP